MRAVDLFAGAGGWTTGATQLGIRVAAAVNHWPVAVASHQLNHPETEHRCQDVGLMDPRDLPAHDLLLASPACQGHSRARGTDKPHHDGSRATAWAVVDVAEVTRPRLLAVENVPEFQKWPLFPLWLEALRRLGYDLSLQVLNAADFGVPQERERLFVLGALGRKVPSVRSPGCRGAAANEIIDWNSPKFRPVAQLRSAATQARIARGRARFGRRFVAPFYGSGSGLTGRSVFRPIGTITTIDRWLVVDGNRARVLTVEEDKRAMGFPAAYQLTGTRRDQIIQLGNAVCPPQASGVLEQLLEAA